MQGSEHLTILYETDGQGVGVSFATLPGQIIDICSYMRIFIIEDLKFSR